MTLKRCLWVEAESDVSPLKSIQASNNLIDYSLQHSISELYMQVFRRGYSWFPSRMAKIHPQISQNYEPLGYLLSRCKDVGIELHAWVNIFNLGTSPAPEFIAHFSNSDFQVDNFGVAGNPAGLSIDTPGLWLDPTSPRVKKTIMTVCTDLMAQYPSLSGLHLDFIRYPYYVPIRPGSGISTGADFGYAESSRKIFCDLIQQENPFTQDVQGAIQPKDATIALLWDNFRRNSVTAYIEGIKSLLSAHQALSVAGLAWPDRAYLSAFQDWRMWLQENKIDRLLLMSYTDDKHLFKLQTTQALAFTQDPSRMVAGIGAYKLKSIEEVFEQEQMAGECGAKAVVFFSYAEMAKLLPQVSASQKP